MQTPANAAKPLPGEIWETVNGKMVLILRKDEQNYLVLPVKARKTENTGCVVFLNEQYVTLPVLGGPMFERFAKAKIESINAAMVEKALKCYSKVYKSNDETFDEENNHSAADWGLYRDVIGETYSELVDDLGPAWQEVEGHMVLESWEDYVARYRETYHRDPPTTKLPE